MPHLIMPSVSQIVSLRVSIFWQQHTESNGIVRLNIFSALLKLLTILTLNHFVLPKKNVEFFTKYQPSSAVGTCSKPAKQRRLQHLTACLIQNGLQLYYRNSKILMKNWVTYTLFQIYLTNCGRFPEQFLQA